MDRRAYVTAAAVALVAVAAALVASPAAALEWIDRLAGNPLQFGLALFALALVRPFLAWPTTLLAVAAGYGYGWWGLPIGLGLMVTTSVPPYLLADRFDGGRFAAAGERFVAAAGGLRGLVSVRLLPAPSDVVSIEAGLAGVPLRTYLLGTAVGETPWTVVGVLAGLSLGSLAEGSGLSFDLRLVAAVALLGLLALAEPAYEYLDGRDADESLVERST